ncbi:hypothetical protein AAFF_G00249970 [Aldrovandia affinis]|uniref:palmitoyl-CoA hydrolase n=1 Tax=Aldrovandia affinis TaxID=143900 RepID=A0AAD7RCV2_9TELE|nr:hypothetical protein AAFF_G00249970 [Aldrovandia affinis]
MYSRTIQRHSSGEVNCTVRSTTKGYNKKTNSCITRNSAAVQGKRGNTITINPRKSGAGTASASAPGVTRSCPSAPNPSPYGVEEKGKKRYPTAEEIEVIGGYQTLEKSCLAKGNGTQKTVKVCFDEVQLEQVFEYPSENSVLASFPSPPLPGPEREEEKEEEDDEDDEEGLFLLRSSQTVGTGAGRVLRVDESFEVIGYKPVIVVHGLFDGPKQLADLVRLINKSHPGTNVTVIDLFDGQASLMSLWKQVQGFKQEILPIMQNAADGVHLICFSQGGLVCRGIISTLPDHNVHSFISLSSPQAGQYGETEYLKHVFPKTMKTHIYQICYCSIGQKVSICNYWKDSHHIDKYVKGSNYLAVLNNERPNPNARVWKKNFLRIKKLVLIGGPDDGVITPWQSSHFGFYDANETIVEMKNQDVYLKDVFGLKTLDARGDLVMCVFPGVKHTKWHSNDTVYHGCIDKWLT